MAGLLNTGSEPIISIRNRWVNEVFEGRYAYYHLTGETVPLSPTPTVYNPDGDAPRIGSYVLGEFVVYVPTLPNEPLTPILPLHDLENEIRQRLQSN